MKRLKKGAALAVLVAFLISAVAPLSALAAHPTARVQASKEELAASAFTAGVPFETTIANSWNNFTVVTGENYVKGSELTLTGLVNMAADGTPVSAGESKPATLPSGYLEKEPNAVAWKALEGQWGCVWSKQPIESAEDWKNAAEQDQILDWKSTTAPRNLETRTKQGYGTNSWETTLNSEVTADWPDEGPVYILFLARTQAGEADGLKMPESGAILMYRLNVGTLAATPAKPTANQAVSLSVAIDPMIGTGGNGGTLEAICNVKVADEKGNVVSRPTAAVDETSPTKPTVTFSEPGDYTITADVKWKDVSGAKFEFTDKNATVQVTVEPDPTASTAPAAPALVNGPDQTYTLKSATGPTLSCISAPADSYTATSPNGKIDTMVWKYLRTNNAPTAVSEWTNATQLTGELDVTQTPTKWPDGTEIPSGLQSAARESQLQLTPENTSNWTPGTYYVGCVTTIQPDAAQADPVTEVLQFKVTVSAAPKAKITFDPPSMTIQAGTSPGQMLTAKTQSGTDNQPAGTWSLETTQNGGTVSLEDLISGVNQNPVLVQPKATVPKGSYELTFTPDDSEDIESATYTVQVTAAATTSAQLTWAADNKKSFALNDGPTEFSVNWGSEQDTPLINGGGGVTYAWTSNNPDVIANPIVSRGQNALLTPVGVGTAQITVTAKLENPSSDWAVLVPPSALTVTADVEVTPSSSTSLTLSGPNVETMVGLLPAAGTTLTAETDGETAVGDPTISGTPIGATTVPAPDIFDVSYTPGTSTSNGAASAHRAFCSVTIADGAQAPTVPGTWLYTVAVPATGSQAGVIGTFTLTVSEGVALKPVDVVVRQGPVAANRSLTTLTASQVGETKRGLVTITSTPAAGDGPQPLAVSNFKGTFTAGTSVSPAQVSIAWASAQTLQAGGPWTYRTTVLDNDGNVIASGSFTLNIVDGTYLGAQDISLVSGHVKGGAVLTTLQADRAGETAASTRVVIESASGIVGDSAEDPLNPNAFNAVYVPGTASRPAQANVSWASNRLLSSGGPWTYDVKVNGSSGQIAVGRFTLTIRDRVVVPLTGTDLATEAGSLPSTGTSLRAAASGVTEPGTVRITGAPSGSTTAAAPDIFSAVYAPGTALTPASISVSVKPDAAPPTAAGTWVYTVAAVNSDGDDVAAGTFTLTVTPAAAMPVLAAPATNPTGRPGQNVSVLVPWADDAPSNMNSYAVKVTPTSQTTPATPELELTLNAEGAGGTVAIPADATAGTVYTYDVVLSRGEETQAPIKITVNVSNRLLTLSGPTQTPVYGAVTITAALSGFAEPTVTWSAVGAGNPSATDVVTTSTRSSATFLPTSAGSMVVTATAVDADGSEVTEERVITVGSGGGPSPSPSQSYTVIPFPSQTATPSSTPSLSPSPSPSSTASASGTVTPVPTPSRPVIAPAPAAPSPVEVTTVPGVSGTVITGFPISTRYETHAAVLVSSYITVPNGASVILLTAQGQQIPTNDYSVPFATGQRVRVVSSSGATLSEATIIVPGDVLGTGELNIAQLVRMAQACTGERPLQGPYEAAGDFGTNNRIDIGDVVHEAKLITTRP